MKSLIALTKKEYLEAARTGKIRFFYYFLCCLVL